MERVREMMQMSPDQQRAHFNSQNRAEAMRNQALVDVDAGGANIESVRQIVHSLSDDELFSFWAGNNHNLFVSYCASKYASFLPV